MDFRLISSLFLGWALGANDSANVFGTAVSSRMIKYGTAITLTAIFVMAGAILQGHEGMETLSGLTQQSMKTAFIVSLAAAITVTVMTILKLPISTSQSVVGAIIGVGIMQSSLKLDGLVKVVICWLGTPIGGLLISFLLYHIFIYLLRFFKPNIFIEDSLIRLGLIIAGCYGAYALGANNVANVTGVFVGNMLTPFMATLIGGASIAFGAVTFSRNVMKTVGKSIVKLDAFSAFITVLAHSVTVHIYAMIGVPVSTSQAIVGAVLAIGLIKGTQTVQFNTLFKVFFGWLLTPVVSLALSVAIYFIMHLKYVPA